MSNPTFVPTFAIRVTPCSDDLHDDDLDIAGLYIAQTPRSDEFKALPDEIKATHCLNSFYYSFAIKILDDFIIEVVDQEGTVYTPDDNLESSEPFFAIDFVFETKFP